MLLIRYIGGPIVGLGILATGYAPDRYRPLVTWLTLAIMIAFWLRAAHTLRTSYRRAATIERERTARASWRAVLTTLQETDAPSQLVAPSSREVAIGETPAAHR